MEVDDIFGYDWGAYTPRVSRSALWPNLLCRRPARIRCEDYGKIVLQRGVHRFNYESLQTLADVGRAHSSNIIVMICDDGLNCGNFLLGSHAGTFNFCSASAIENGTKFLSREHLDFVKDEILRRRQSLRFHAQAAVLCEHLVAEPALDRREVFAHHHRLAILPAWRPRF